MLTTAYHASLVDVLAAGIGDVSPAAPPGSQKFLTLLSWIMWGAVVVCIVGFIAAAATLAWQRMQGGGGDAHGKLVGAMIGAVLIGIGATLINTLALS